MLCPELIPESSEVLSLTMKPNNLSPLHKRKKRLLFVSSLSESPGVNQLLLLFFNFIPVLIGSSLM